jgi:c-di-GMP-binding flagellar brake protein YcgR
MDAGFKFSEIRLLRKLSRTTRLEYPVALFWSVSALTHSIKRAIDGARISGKINSDDFQQFLAKLYAYRTKVELENSNKKTIASTKNLGQGQRVRILVRGEGVFSSQLINNGRELVVTFPKRQKGKALSSGMRWKGTQVSVYLWRKNDASYTFDTVVLRDGFFHDFPVLYLAHTDNVFRTQKRKSVRAAAKLYGEIFLYTVTDEGRKKQPNGLKCFLEDISADGALIRVGGKAAKGISLLLEFPLADRLISMDGVVRGVEFNTELNQSRLHFECEKIDTESKNVILSYVYNVLPQEEREVLNAIELAKNDALAEETSGDEKDKIP